MSNMVTANTVREFVQGVAPNKNQYDMKSSIQLANDSDLHNPAASQYLEVIEAEFNRRGFTRIPHDEYLRKVGDPYDQAIAAVSSSLKMVYLNEQLVPGAALHTLIHELVHVIQDERDRYVANGLDMLFGSRVFYIREQVADVTASMVTGALGVTNRLFGESYVALYTSSGVFMGSEEYRWVAEVANEIIELLSVVHG